MRVLHLLKTSVGAQWALRQMRELIGLRVDVHVALPAGGPLVAACQAAGIVVHLGQFDVPVARPWTFPRVARDLRRLVAQVQPDLIHSHFVGTTMTTRMALGAAHETPRVFQVPGPLHLEHGLFRHAELFTAGKADYWIGSCRWTHDRYGRAGVPSDRRFLSYYGSDLESLEVAGASGLRAELSVGPTQRLVGMVAYFYAPRLWLGQRRGIKGHEDLIDAAAVCVARGYDIVCVFVGGPWREAHQYEGRVREYARRRLGTRAVFLGTRPDVPALYRAFDVAVHPSHSENVGGAAESLLIGVPTIATSVGGFPDVVVPDETGWLVPPGRPAVLADAIAEALDHPGRARRMAAEGRRRAQRLLDVKENAREIADIYRTILARRPGAPGIAA
jgi:glycosyltransferase involved in cell wall biosynthesis